MPHVLHRVPRARHQRGLCRARAAAPHRNQSRRLHLSRLYGVPDVLPGRRLDRRGGERPLDGAAAPRCVAELTRRHPMHPILEEFCDKWVWPTMPGAPGAEFRLKLTREKCLLAWEAILERTVHDIEEELTSNDEEWKRQHALRGYAAEGVHMSIKQMSAQLLSVDIGEQENYIDLPRIRARQIWHECKHSQLHADVLLGKGWVAN